MSVIANVVNVVLFIEMVSFECIINVAVFLLGLHTYIHSFFLPLPNYDVTLNETGFFERKQIDRSYYYIIIQDTSG